MPTHLATHLQETEVFLADIHLRSCHQVLKSVIVGELNYATVLEGY